MMDLTNIDRAGIGHVAYLDGWRGLAVLLLLVGHFFPVPGINLGTVGVNLFFVLSGLLMAGLLFERQESLARFYRRRAARIVPAHLSFIVLVSCVYAVLGLPLSAREVLSALFFMNNYIQPAGGPGSALMPFGHIWSLAVEEHSYVALSLVALGCRRRLFSASAGVGFLLAVTICSALYYQWLNPPQLAFAQWLHTEVAAYGLLGTAWWVASGRRQPVQAIASSAPVLMLVWGIAWHWWSIPLAMQKLLGVGCFVSCICALTVTRGWFASLLSLKPLRQLGLWSYSIYLWQQPFYLWTHDRHSIPAPLALLMALSCGLLSYYLVERPARNYLNAHWGAGTAAARSCA